MKKKNRIIAFWACMTLLFCSVAGCGTEDETSESSSYKYNSVEEMQSDVVGTYTLEFTIASAGYSKTMDITSTKVMTTFTLTESGKSYDSVYEISEWIPEPGFIVLEEYEDLEDNILTVTRDGDVMFGDAFYEKVGSESDKKLDATQNESETEVVEILTDAYTTYAKPENTWEYFPQEKYIPIPTSCINGLQEYISDGGVYTYILEDETVDSLNDIITAYTTILMKDCGLALESISNGVYSVSKNSSIIAICGEGYDSDNDKKYLVVTISSDESGAEDEQEFDITDPIDSSGSSNNSGTGLKPRPQS